MTPIDSARRAPGQHQGSPRFHPFPLYESRSCAQTKEPDEEDIYFVTNRLIQLSDFSVLIEMFVTNNKLLVFSPRWDHQIDDRTVSVEVEVHNVAILVQMTPL